MKHDRKMPGDSAGDPRALALDPDLLASPFRVQTNWHVITGGACSGKTTLIHLLAAQGFQTVPEVSRRYIEEEVAKGRALDDIFGSEADERALTDLRVQTERALPATELLFLDRALPDYLWFWRLLGMDPNELLPACFYHRYASVFVLDLLPLELDGARIDDEDYTVRFDQALVRDYGALGYDVVRVPVLPPQERLAFVLERLAEQGQV